MIATITLDIKGFLVVETTGPSLEACIDRAYDEARRHLKAQGVEEIELTLVETERSD